MEHEQETNQDAEIIPSDENEVIEELENLKNDGIQTLKIMPFAVPRHGWNDLKDSVSWAETLVGMNSALKNHMAKYNKLIDTVAQLTRDFNTDISQLQVSLTGTHSIAKDASTKVTNAITRINNLDAWRVDQTALNTNLKNWRDTSTAEISALWNSNTARKNETTNNLNEIKLLWSSNDLRKAEIATLNANVTQLFANTTGLSKSNDLRMAETAALSKSNDLRKAEIQAHSSEISDLWSSNTLRIAQISTLNDNVTQLFANTTALSKSNDLRKEEIQAHGTEITNLWSSNTLRIAEISTLKENVTQLFANTTALSKSNDLRKEEIQAHGTEINKLWTANDTRTSDIKKIDTRLKEIESFDFGSIIDLTILVTAINAVGSKVQDLIDLFNVTKVEPGTFTFFLQGSIKTQTDAIIQALAMVDESLNNNFINYFDDSINGKFWKAFKEFDDFQMAVFFEVFFENYRLELDKTWVNTLDVWNTTNGYLDSSYNALVIITQWLKQIYEKPGTPAIVNVPPFDYERLEKMLKKLEFGEITNEAGTNIWDFLKELIATLGETLTGILEFLDSLLDKLISLVVPSDTIFITSGFESIKMKFNVKFGALLGLAESLKDLFTPTPTDFKQAVSFDFLGAKFEPDFSMIDPYVKKFRVVMSLSLWMSVVVFIFKKITGTGDLINDN